MNRTQVDTKSSSLPITDSGQNIGNANTEDISLGDIDEDGDLDAFVANWSQANKVWLNDGDGNFTDSGQELGNLDSRGVVLDDIDGDGDLDAFIANGPLQHEYNGSGDFIVAVACGTTMAEKVRILSEFRDKFLVTNRMGRWLTQKYYESGQCAARFISKHEALRAVVRVWLVPFILLANFMLRVTLWKKLFVSTIILVLILIGTRYIKRGMRARNQGGG